MFETIHNLVRAFESGKVNRRELVAGLGAMMLGAAALPAAAASAPAPAGSTFRSTGLNHIALSVTDVGRSRDFYVRHLGAKVLRDGERNGFLGCGGNNFIGLFRSSRPGMAHYAYTVEDYDAGLAVKTLEAAGLEPERHEDRVYFDDPDGLTVQLTGEWDDFPGPRP